MPEATTIGSPANAIRLKFDALRVQDAFANEQDAIRRSQPSRSMRQVVARSSSVGVPMA